jgi:hypothetical protein
MLKFPLPVADLKAELLGVRIDVRDQRLNLCSLWLLPPAESLFQITAFSPEKD